MSQLTNRKFKLGHMPTNKSHAQNMSKKTQECLIETHENSQDDLKQGANPVVDTLRSVSLSGIVDKNAGNEPAQWTLSHPTSTHDLGGGVMEFCKKRRRIGNGNPIQILQENTRNMIQINENYNKVMD